LSLELLALALSDHDALVTFAAQAIVRNAELGVLIVFSEKKGDSSHGFSPWLLGVCGYAAARRAPARRRSSPARGRFRRRAATRDLPSRPWLRGLRGSTRSLHA